VPGLVPLGGHYVPAKNAGADLSVCLFGTNQYKNWNEVGTDRVRVVYPTGKLLYMYWSSFVDGIPRPKSFPFTIIYHFRSISGGVNESVLTFSDTTVDNKYIFIARRSLNNEVICEINLGGTVDKVFSTQTGFVNGAEVSLVVSFHSADYVVLATNGLAVTDTLPNSSGSFFTPDYAGIGIRKHQSVTYYYDSNVYSYQLLLRGVSVSEAVSLSRDPYQFLIPA
jgi:hypothetical protein